MAVIQVYSSNKLRYNDTATGNRHEGTRNKARRHRQNQGRMARPRRGRLYQLCGAGRPRKRSRSRSSSRKTGLSLAPTYVYDIAWLRYAGAVPHATGEA